MARKAANLKLEERVGTIRTPAPTPRIPSWLLYSGIGTAAIGALAAGYFGLRSLGVPLPPQPRQAEQGQKQQYAPPQNNIEITTQIPGIENVMSTEQVKATIEEILAIGRPLTNEDKDVWRKVEDVNKSIYFMLTGRTLEQDNLGIKIMPREEYDATVHPQLKGTAGTAFYGNNDIIYAAAIATPRIDETSARTLLLLVANELGNAKDARVVGRAISANPDPEIKRAGDPGGVYEGGVLFEASKHMYQAAFLHLAGEIDVAGISIADTDANKEQIKLGIERKLDNVGYGIVPDDGWAVAWWYTLNDAEARRELEDTGKLSSRTALKVHNAILAELVASIGHPENYRQKIQEILVSKANLQQPILDASYKRMLPAGQIRNVAPGDAGFLFVP